MKKCYNFNENKQDCKCTYEPCERKGICCECVRYHLRMSQVPACFFSAGAESTYDRSTENFIKDYSSKGRS